MNFASTNSSPENRGSRVRDGQKPREFSGFLAIWHPGARRPETPFLAIPHPGGAAQKPQHGGGDAGMGRMGPPWAPMGPWEYPK